MSDAKHPDSALRQATEESILERLANGESLVQICKSPGMPSRMTVQRWQSDDDEFDVAVMRAREAGMFVRAENAVEAAKCAEDAGLGRLAFDAERWYVGKLSNAFSDDKARKHEVKHSMDEETAAWLGQTS